MNKNKMKAKVIKLKATVEGDNHEKINHNDQKLIELESDLADVLGLIDTALKDQNMTNSNS